MRAQLVAALAAIELDQNAPAIRLVVNEAEQVEGLDKPAQLFQGAGQLGRAVLGLQGPDQAGSLHGAELEGAGQAQQIFPVLDDERDVDALGGQGIQGAIVRLAAHAPEARAADVGQPRAELVAQEVENPEDRIGVGTGIRHDLGWL